MMYNNNSNIMKYFHSFCIVLCLCLSFTEYEVVDGIILGSGGLGKDRKEPKPKNVFGESKLSASLRTILDDHSPSELSKDTLESGGFMRPYSPKQKFAYDKESWFVEYPEEAYERRVHKFLSSVNFAKLARDKSALLTVLKYFRKWDWEAVAILLHHGRIIEANLQNLKSSKSVGTSILHEVIKGPKSKAGRLSADANRLASWLSVILLRDPKLASVKDKKGLDYLQLARSLYQGPVEVHGGIILKQCEEFSRGQLADLQFYPPFAVCSDEQKIKSDIFASLLSRSASVDLLFPPFVDRKLLDPLYREMNDIVDMIEAKRYESINGGASQLLSMTNTLQNPQQHQQHHHHHHHHHHQMKAIAPSSSSSSSSSVSAEGQSKSRSMKSVRMHKEATVLHFNKNKPDTLAYHISRKEVTPASSSSSSSSSSELKTPLYATFVDKLVRHGQSVPLMRKMIKEDLKALKCRPSAYRILEVFRDRDFDRIQFLIDSLFDNETISNSPSAAAFAATVIKSYLPAYIFGPYDFQELSKEDSAEFLNILRQMLQKCKGEISDSVAEEIHAALQIRAKYKNYIDEVIDVMARYLKFK